ncbi:MAG: oligosaccharide flippase family protein [Victivallaceae bacterium]|nr:oligosaccharide flippase family protein [Victivallaceae bacterium]
MNQKKIGATLVYLRTVISVAISLVYTPYMLRVLGRSEYGAIQLAGSMISYLNLIGLGVSASYIRFNIQSRKDGDKNREYELNGAYFSIFLIMGFLALIGGLILVWYANDIMGSKISADEYELLKKLMLICVVNLTISFPGSIFRMMLNAYEKFFFIHVIETITAILSPALCFILLFSGYRSISLMLIALVSNVIQIAANATYALKKLHLKIIFKRHKLIYYREILVFSGFIFINQIVNTINWNVDSYLTALFIGTAGTAIYAFGYQFENYFITLSTAISNVFAPQVNNLVVHHDQEGINECFCRIGRLQAILLLFVLGVYLVIGKQFVVLFAGENYLTSFYISAILMGATVIPLSQNLGIEIQRAMNKHQFRSFLYLTIAIVNIIISIPLCKSYGVIGCVVGTAIGQVVGNTIIMNFYYKYKIKINVNRYFREVAKVLPSIGGSLLICFLLEQFWDGQERILQLFLRGSESGLMRVGGFLVLGVAVSAIFAVNIWCFCLNRYEKDIILGFWGTTKKKKTDIL